MNWSVLLPRLLARWLVAIFVLFSFEFFFMFFVLARRLPRYSFFLCLRIRLICFRSAVHIYHLIFAVPLLLQLLLLLLLRFWIRRHINPYFLHGPHFDCSLWAIFPLLGTPMARILGTFLRHPHPVCLLAASFPLVDTPIDTHHGYCQCFVLLLFLVRRKTCT